MLTGRRLFKATNEFTGARMVLDSAIALPSTVNEEVSPEVDRVVMRALERNRDARYLTAGEMAEDLEKLLFDMRASPHAPRKLLLSLFPEGPSRRSEFNLPLTPSPLLIASGEFSPTPSPSMRTPPPPSMPTKDLADVGAEPMKSGPTALEGRRKRRKPVVAIALLGAAAGIAVLALPHRTATPPQVAVAPVAVAAQQPPEPSPPPAPAARPTVDVSLDSSPQDAQVIREDSGEVVGRTPLTIKLPQAHDVISFRFEKPGHAPASYKVIPDLDKSVRAELTVEPAVDSRHAPASHRSTSAHGRPTANHGARPGVPEPAAPGPDQPRDCMVSVASFPWADLWIDGKDTGQRTPVVHYPVSCGAHKLTLKRRDLRLDRSEQVTVAPGHELKQHYELSDEYGD
jgi:hypothetical protein